jgi:hypothetical protein
VSKPLHTPSVSHWREVKEYSTYEPLQFMRCLQCNRHPSALNRFGAWNTSFLSSISIFKYPDPIKGASKLFRRRINQCIKEGTYRAARQRYKNEGCIECRMPHLISKSHHVYHEIHFCDCCRPPGPSIHGRCSVPTHVLRRPRTGL